MNILQEKWSFAYFLQVFCLLSKNFLNSFGFFLAIWRRRECVGAVTVRWPLRQSSQIQVVGALSFSFSYATQKPRETSQSHDHEWCAQTSETGSSEGNQSDTSFKSFTIKANILLHACNRCLKYTVRLLVYKCLRVFWGTFSNSIKVTLWWICKKKKKRFHANKWVHTTHAGDTQRGESTEKKLYAAHSRAGQE